jgi:hypothetical protein
MRHLMAFGLALAVFGSALAGSPAGTAPAGKAAAPPTPEYMIKNTPSGDAALARLKSLVGSWTGTTKEGKSVQVTYRMISNDTCIEESIHSADAMDMVSVYCPDRDGVMMTHYCASNSQPRMRTKDSGDGGRMVFTFVDATNLSSPKAGHMKNLVMVFDGKDRLTQEWTWSADGKDATEIFQYQRAAS